jgi:uncharacterized protein YaiE (UPF0345 family)
MNNAIFDKVSVVKTANIYFNGRVTSRTIIFADGSQKTLGIMLEGVYQFDTKDNELMEIQAGKVDVLLPNTQIWQRFEAGAHFKVPKNTCFKVKVLETLDYCCSYF